MWVSYDLNSNDLVAGTIKNDNIETALFIQIGNMSGKKIQYKVTV